MPQYLIEYEFNGNGVVYIEARDKKQAEEMFFDGEFQDQQESGSSYNIISTTLNKKI